MKSLIAMKAGDQGSPTRSYTHKKRDMYDSAEENPTTAL
jgi:hypothetical protein